MHDFEYLLLAVLDLHIQQTAAKGKKAMDALTNWMHLHIHLSLASNSSMEEIMNVYLNLSHDAWQGVVDALVGLMVEVLDNMPNTYNDSVGEIVFHPYMLIEPILDSWDEKAYDSFRQYLDSLLAALLYGNPLRRDLPCLLISMQAVSELVLRLKPKKGQAGLPAVLMESFNSVKKEERSWLRAHA